MVQVVLRLHAATTLMFLPLCIVRRTSSSSVLKLSSLPGYSFRETVVHFEKLDSPVKLLEADAITQNMLVDIALDATDAVNSDPYGSVLWPAAWTVANRLLETYDLKSTRVVEIGTGTGLVSLCCALAGAKSVLATDYHPLTLTLVKEAALRQTPPVSLRTQLLDIKGPEPLPDGDLLVISDLLYEPALGRAVGRRVHEAVRNGMRVIIGDSPNRPGRSHMLSTMKELGLSVPFKEVAGQTVTGPRHSLISDSSTEIPMFVPISLLEI